MIQAPAMASDGASDQAAGSPAAAEGTHTNTSPPPAPCVRLSDRGAHTNTCPPPAPDQATHAHTSPASDQDTHAHTSPASDQGSHTNTSPPPAPCVNLSDLDAACMQQLLTTLSPGDRAPLFQSCTAMRDLILSLFQVRIQFKHPLTLDREAAQASLQRACQLSPCVTLVRMGNPHASPGGIANQCDWMEEAMAATGGRGLTVVKSMELHDLVLDGLVPPWLSTCPHTTSLTLQSCQFLHLPEPSTALSAPTVTASAQLQQLHLGFRQYAVHDKSMPRWQHQLRALTALTALSLSGEPESIPPRFIACCSVIGAQLTALQCAPAFMPQELPQQLPAWFPNIKTLHVDGTTIEDAGMAVLLDLRSLKRLHCWRFRLRKNYTQRDCSWTELAFRELDVESFARLPLDGLQSLQARSLDGCCFLVCASDSVWAISKVVAVVMRLGGLQWGDDGVEMVQLIYRSADPACLEANLPILSVCKAQRLRMSFRTQVTPRLLAVMQHYIFSANPSLVTIVLDVNDFAGAALPLVLPSLPPQVHTLQLVVTRFRTYEADFTAMCVHATRPIRVHVIFDDESEHWGEGWQLRVCAAMAAAGHQHVQLHDQV